MGNYWLMGFKDGQLSLLITNPLRKKALRYARRHYKEHDKFLVECNNTHETLFKSVKSRIYIPKSQATPEPKTVEEKAPSCLITLDEATMRHFAYTYYKVANLNKAETARLLGVTPKTVYNYLERYRTRIMHLELTEEMNYGTKTIDELTRYLYKITAENTKSNIDAALALGITYSSYYKNRRNFGSTIPTTVKKKVAKNRKIRKYKKPKSPVKKPTVVKAEIPNYIPKAPSDLNEKQLHHFIFTYIIKAKKDIDETAQLLNIHPGTARELVYQLGNCSGIGVEKAWDYGDFTLRDLA